MADLTDTETIIETGAGGAAVDSGPYAPVDVEAVIEGECADIDAGIDCVVGARLDAEQLEIAALVADGVPPDEIRSGRKLSERRLAEMLADPGVQAEIGRQVLGAGLAGRDEQVKARKRVLNVMRAELNKRAAAGDFSDMRLADLLKEFRAGLKELRDITTGGDAGGGAPGTVNNILVNIQNMSPQQLNEFVRRQTRTMQLIPGGRRG